MGVIELLAMLIVASERAGIIGSMTTETAFVEAGFERAATLTPWLELAPVNAIGMKNNSRPTTGKNIQLGALLGV